MAKSRACSVSLTFISNDDVIQHINEADELLSPVKKTKKGSAAPPVQTLHATPGVTPGGRPRRGTKKPVSYNEKDIAAANEQIQSSSSEEDEEDEEEEDGESGDEENLNPNPEVLLGQQDAVAGGAVYQFKTPKRSGRMTKLAAQAVTPLFLKKVTSSTKKTKVTPLLLRKDTSATASKTTPAYSSRKVNQKTPATSTRKRTARGTAATPASSAAGNNSNLRRSTRKRKPILPESDEESEYSPEESSSDEEDEQETRHDGSSDSDSDAQSTTSSKDSGSSRGSRRGRGRGGTRGKTANGTTPGRPGRRKPRGDVDVANMHEEYFEAHASIPMTSDHTLSRLDIPQMDSQQLHKTLDGVANNYSTEISELYEEYKSMFNKWMFQLSNGFNLMLYGLGSKRILIEKFRGRCLGDWPQLVINGFFPSLTIKSILNSISDGVLGRDASFKNVTEQMEFIEETLEENQDELFVIIHNIDGAMLRGSKVQSILSNLAQIPALHIVASIDHINAPLIWDQARASSFNWLCYDVTTYEPYIEETSYENSLLVQQSGVLALSSLTHVLRSLTPNARGIFSLLVHYQLEHKDDGAYNGLSFHELYQKCREAFLVNSDLTLRAQLTEFRDHKLIRSRKGVDGIELLYLPVDSGTLTEFMQQEDL